MNGGNARMDRIVIAFAHNAAREKAGLLLEQCGHPACASVRSGAEVLRMVRSWDGAVVVCGYRLADMTVDMLSERIEGRAKLLLLASPANLAQVDDERIARVPSPVSRQAFLEALQALLGEKHPPEEAPANSSAVCAIAAGWSRRRGRLSSPARSMHDIEPCIRKAGNPVYGFPAFGGYELTGASAGSSNSSASTGCRRGRPCSGGG